MTATYVFELRTKPGMQDEAVRSFDIYRRMPGFKSIEILKDPDYDDRIFCIEKWESEQAHKAFLAQLSQHDQRVWLGRLVGAPHLHGRFRDHSGFSI
jgi:heme-degrading monooxygenase HmoA